MGLNRLKKYLNASKLSEHTPDKGENVKRFKRGTQIVGFKDKIFSWHLIGFPDGSSKGFNSITSGRNPLLNFILTTLIAMQGHQNGSKNTG